MDGGTSCKDGEKHYLYITVLRNKNPIQQIGKSNWLYGAIHEAGSIPTCSCRGALEKLHNVVGRYGKLLQADMGGRENIISKRGKKRVVSGKVIFLYGMAEVLSVRFFQLPGKRGQASLELTRKFQKNQLRGRIP